MWQVFNPHNTHECRPPRFFNENDAVPGVGSIWKCLDCGSLHKVISVDSERIPMHRKPSFIRYRLAYNLLSAEQ